MRENPPIGGLMSYTPRVVVKFQDFLSEDDSLQYNPRLYVKEADWNQLKRQFPGITIEKRLTSMTPQQLIGIVKEAKELDPDYQASDNLFLTYFAVTGYPSDIDPQTVARRLRSLPRVELAYVEGRYTGPSGTKPGSTTEPIDTYQQYLCPAPNGIDAKYAWNVPGGDGGNAEVDLGFVDIEQGWLIAADYPQPHEDLPSDIQRI